MDVLYKPGYKNDALPALFKALQNKENMIRRHVLNVIDTTCEADPLIKKELQHY